MLGTLSGTDGKIDRIVSIFSQNIEQMISPAILMMCDPEESVLVPNGVFCLQNSTSAFNFQSFVQVS